MFTACLCFLRRALINSQLFIATRLNRGALAAPIKLLLALIAGNCVALSASAAPRIIVVTPATAEFFYPATASSSARGLWCRITNLHSAKPKVLPGRMRRMMDQGARMLFIVTPRGPKAKRLKLKCIDLARQLAAVA